MASASAAIATAKRHPALLAGCVPFHPLHEEAPLLAAKTPAAMAAGLLDLDQQQVQHHTCHLPNQHLLPHLWPLQLSTLL